MVYMDCGRNVVRGGTNTYILLPTLPPLSPTLFSTRSLLCSFCASPYLSVPFVLLFPLSICPSFPLILFSISLCAFCSYMWGCLFLLGGLIVFLRGMIAGFSFEIGQLLLFRLSVFIQHIIVKLILYPILIPSLCLYFSLQLGVLITYSYLYYL